MMPLGLQPAVLPSPADGLSAQSQSRDSETTQSPSFGEVLKVEEKKLQQAQESNSLSIAALLATMQPQSLTESMPILDAGTHSKATKPAGQTAPTLDPVKSKDGSPLQSAPPNKKPENTQRSTLVKTQINLPNTTQAKASLVNNIPSTKPQATSISQTREESLSRTVKTSQDNAATFEARSTDQAVSPTPKDAPTPTSKITTPVIQTENTNQTTDEKTTVHIKEVNTTSKQLETKAEVKSKPSEPQAKPMSAVQSAQEEIKTPNFLEVPAQNKAIPTTNDREIKADQKAHATATQPAKTKVDLAESPEAEIKSETPTTKKSVQVNLGHSENIPVYMDEKLEVNQKPTIKETKPVDLIQTDVPEVDFTGFVKKSSSKGTSPEITNPIKNVVAAEDEFIHYTSAIQAEPMDSALNDVYFVKKADISSRQATSPVFHTQNKPTVNSEDQNLIKPDEKPTRTITNPSESAIPSIDEGSKPLVSEAAHPQRNMSVLEIKPKTNEAIVNILPPVDKTNTQATKLIESDTTDKYTNTVMNDAPSVNTKPAQTTESVAEFLQPVFEVKPQITEPIKPDAANKHASVSVEGTASVDVRPVQMAKSVIEFSQPVTKLNPQTIEPTKPDTFEKTSQTNESVDNISRSADKASAPVKNAAESDVTVKEETAPVESETSIGQKAFITNARTAKPVQINHSITDASQPIDKVNFSGKDTIKPVVITQNRNVPATESKINVDQNILAAKTMPAEPIQQAMTEAGLQQPANKIGENSDVKAENTPITIENRNKNTSTSNLKLVDTTQANVTVTEVPQNVKTSSPDATIRKEKAPTIIADKTEVVSQKPIAIEFKPTAIAQTNLPTVEAQTVLNKVFIPAAKTMASDVVAKDMSIVDSVAGTQIPETRPAQSVQINVSANDVEQPVSKAKISAINTASQEVFGKSKVESLVVNDEGTDHQQKPIAMETISTGPIRTSSTEQEVSHPTNKTNVPTAKAVSTDRVEVGEAVEVRNEIKGKQKNTSVGTKPVELAHIEKISFEDSQSSENTSTEEIISANANLSNGHNESKILRSQSVLPQNDMDIPNQKSSVEMKSIEPRQAKAPDFEVSKPATTVISAEADVESETVSPLKNITLNNSEENRPASFEVLRPQSSFPQSEVDVFETDSSISTAQVDISDSSKANQKPLVLDASSVETDAIVRNTENTEFPVTENFRSKEASKPLTAQPQARFLSADVQAAESSSQVMAEPTSMDFRHMAPVLSADNASAENNLKNGIKPTVKDEAFGFAQKNIPSEVQADVNARSNRVENQVDEKQLSKDIERKPVADLESTVVVHGPETTGAKTAEKLFVAKNEPVVADVIKQITSQMKARIKSGETSIHMQLNPGELGAIEVQMIHNAQGVSVSFIAEQASTGQLLESQVSQLRQSLKDAGVQLANLNINQHHQPNQEGGAFKQGHPFMQTPRREVSQTETPHKERMRPQRIGGPTSEIDYLI